jgi:hypothetical protein
VTLSSATKKKLATVRESSVRALAVLACVLAVAAGCGDSSSSALPAGSEPVTLDPADFTTEITNPYWPMAPGDRWVYRETDGRGGEQQVVVTVTDRTRTIAGIEARVVHDVVSEEGELVEDTFDWYAQDAGGNVWYLGEHTREFEKGKVTTTAGSWEHGVDGAQAGIAVPAAPRAGLEYRQEYYAGEAEDGTRLWSALSSNRCCMDGGWGGWWCSASPAAPAARSSSAAASRSSNRRRGAAGRPRPSR